MSLFESDDVVPLISLNGDGTYHVDEDTASFLSGVRTPVAIVSVAGRFRTGKSALINTLCDCDGAFAVGETVNACTKGIRIRKTPLHASKALTVFVVDTEGIGSLTADSDHDTKILSLALMLSSSFIFNSIGAVDEAALQSLGLMTRVSEFIRVDAESEASETELARFFPRFYWCLRDFSLRLESATGERCSETEYLEEALADASEGNQERNNVRKSLREAFPRRSLVTLPRPAENTQRLSRRTMSSKFLAGVKALRERILDEIEPLRAGEHALTGAMFAEVCSYYAKTLNKPGAVPCIRDSWSMLTELQSREALASVLREAQEEMRTAAATRTNPTALRQALDEVIEGSVAAFTRRLMQPDVTRSEELRDGLRADAERHLSECQAAFDRKIEQSMHLLEAEANRTDAELGEIAVLVQQAMRQLEIDLGDDPHGLSRWRARCLDNLVNVWIPRLVHTYENEKELHTLAADELRSRYEDAARLLEEARTATAREAERLRRDAELQIESSTMALTMQLEAKDADLRDERERSEALEKVLTDLRLELATLNARIASAHQQEAASGGSGEAEGAAADPADPASAAEGDRPPHDESVKDPSEEERSRLHESRQRIVQLETDKRMLDDELRELRTIRDTLATQCANERQEREKIELTFQQRLQALQTKQSDLVERLRHDHDEAMRKIRDEASAATQKENEWRREISLAQQQASRAEAVRDEGEQLRQREIRVCQEAQLTVRAMFEDLQVRMVEMQKSSLSDLRMREQNHRDKLAEVMTEQLAAQMQRGEAQRREERAMNEVSELKRKISSTDETQRESKRLREAVEEHKGRSEQLASENDRLRVRLEEAVAERERLRAAHIAAESERAATRREVDLMRAEKRMEYGGIATDSK